MKTIPVYDVIDGERIYNTWELPRGAKCQVHYVRQEKGKPDVEGDCVAVFQKMDGMYGLWSDEETGEPLIFNGKFKQIDQDCFCLLTNEKRQMSRNGIIDWTYENKGSIILTIVVIVLFILLCYSLPSGEKLKAMAEKARVDYEQYQATKVDRWKQEYCVGLSEEECSDLIIEFKKEEFKEKNYGHPLTATEYFILR